MADTHFEAGFHSVRWDGKDHSGNPVSSGLYLYKMTAGSFVQVRKMSLLR
ncbi:MAG: FlgD immunoglobulin-like domain containing protein [bacterium]